MKTKKVILFGIANLTALVIIMAVIERTVQVNKFGDRFKPNSFIMSDSVTLHASNNDVYQFYIHHYDEVYHKTADKHHEFKVLNSDSITLGTEIYCREGELNKMIYHHYIVEKIIPDRLVYKSSKPTIVKIKTKSGVKENRCNAFVYVDFIGLTVNESRVNFTIAIQMPNYFYKLIGRLAGGKKAKKEWEDHLREELTGFREQYYLSENVTRN